MAGLDRTTEDAAAALSAQVRGLMFNAHRESLVYTLDDVVYRVDGGCPNRVEGDCPGFRVKDGRAEGLIASDEEAAFVRAMWVEAEKARAIESDTANLIAEIEKLDDIAPDGP